MKIKPLFWIGLVCLVGGAIAYLSWMRSNIAASKTATSTIPADFTEMMNESGIKVWRSKDSNTFVTEIDLTQAQLHSVAGELPGNGKVGQRSIQQFWEQASMRSSGTPKVMINGTFFQTYDRPTGIAFGFKQAGKTVTYGYGLNEFPTLTTTVAWNENSIAIAPYDRRTFDGKMPNVVGTLDPTAGKNADRYLPRTFIGTKNSGEDGVDRTALFFSSMSARQQDAVATLTNFGATQTAMLDGGRSTGLVINGKVIMQPKTKIPQAIGVFSR
jgi:hypothetical protein